MAGSFLIVYFISMLLCGIPIFVLEVAVGQYLGQGGMTLVGRLCPLLGGTGVATMVLVSLLNVYYCVIVGWAIFYLIVSLATLPSLPWDTCGQILHFSIPCNNDLTSHLGCDGQIKHKHPFVGSKQFYSVVLPNVSSYYGVLVITIFPPQTPGGTQRNVSTSTPQQTPPPPT